MAFKYLHNTDIKEALDQYLSVLTNNGLKPECETIDIADSIGRTSFNPVYAKISAPHYHASAMDGIAVQAKKTYMASATTPVRLKASEYKCVDTGDAIPKGFDAVIMVEDLMFKSDDEAEIKKGSCDVEIIASVSPWTNIRQIGEDICAGEMIITAGEIIKPETIGGFMACGITKVDVCKKPCIGIIPTGDEIVEQKENPQAGEIIEFNSSIFSGMIKDWGGSTKTYPITKDLKDNLILALKTALKECDIVLLLAGSSAGRDDYASEAIDKVADILYHGLSIKPGKPAILAASKNKAIIGVPGYPASGVVVLEKILKPIMSIKTKTDLNKDNIITASISRRINSSLKYEETIRVTLGNVNGKIIASPLNRGAGVVTSLIKSDGVITIDKNSEGLEAGTTVKVKTKLTKADINNTLLVIGSHDPAIDEVSNLLHQRDNKYKLSSTHVGSMGAIMAAKRGEMHAGGIHLLDEATGTYNLPYVKKFLDFKNYSIVECVYRKQGIIVAKGNPKNITCFNDLTRDDIVFVNRQKGSGTRILSNYMCKQNSIDENNIYGYDHEEYTHNSLATQIKNNSADAGIGIYSAAKMYNLDFIELCEEQYDLLIPNFAMELPQVKLMLEIIQSDDFKEKINSLGGYRLENPGKIRQF